MKKLDHCCRSWLEVTGNIEVTPKQLCNPQESYMAKTMEQLMKHFMGQYCPCCGTKLA